MALVWIFRRIFTSMSCVCVCVCVCVQYVSFNQAFPSFPRPLSVWKRAGSPLSSHQWNEGASHAGGCAACRACMSDSGVCMTCSIFCVLSIVLSFLSLFVLFLGLYWNEPEAQGNHQVCHLSPSTTTTTTTPNSPPPCCRFKDDMGSKLVLRFLKELCNDEHKNNQALCRTQVSHVLEYN